MTQNAIRIIPIYTSNGDAEAFLKFPYLYNRLGEWIGFVTPKREVYSVVGTFVGKLSDDARITRRRSEDGTHSSIQPPPSPEKIKIPASVPLPPMMSDLPIGVTDILQEEPERLHTLDSGELREDMD